jgi:hypothetical protein
MSKAPARKRVIREDAHMRALDRASNAERDLGVARRMLQDRDENRINEIDRLKVENLTLRKQADARTAALNAAHNHIRIVEHQLSIVRQTVSNVIVLEGVSVDNHGGMTSGPPVPTLTRNDIMRRLPT